MTCILVAHLGSEVIVAADKRLSQYLQDGSRIVVHDNEEKIVRTEHGVITGVGSVEMLDFVKSAVRDYGFQDPFDVLNLIIKTRESFALRYAQSLRLEADLATTGWMFTYPTIFEGEDVTRFVYFHPSGGADSLRGLEAGEVKCFPGGFSIEEAREVEIELKRKVIDAHGSLPAEQVRNRVVACMCALMEEISQRSSTVSSSCDVTVIQCGHVFIAKDVSQENLPVTFTPMVHVVSA